MQAPRNSLEAAIAAGLQYVSDASPGFSRKRHRNGFRYCLPDGSPLRDTAHLERIRLLVIPPAWENVWICALDNGHIQASGIDQRLRKQYRYHIAWRRTRDENKFHQMLAFGMALPKLRRRIRQDLLLPGLPREKVLAAVVRLLESTLIRVGNDTYARTNKSYGLTTLKNRHASVQGSRIQFHFRGKSGVEHEIDLEDPALARIVRQCQHLPGQDLFEYLDESGNVRDIHSHDVNDYIRSVTGGEFTAKDFRTWAGTILAARMLLQCPAAESPTALKRNIVEALRGVAKRLGNTLTVCRKCYVHPEIITCYQEGLLQTHLNVPVATIARRIRLPVEEAAVWNLLSTLRQNKHAG